MEKQMTFTDIEYAGRKRITKRERFLGIMDEIILWEEWVAYIQPYYLPEKPGEAAAGHRNDAADVPVANMVSSFRYRIGQKLETFPAYFGE